MRMGLQAEPRRGDRQCRRSGDHEVQAFYALALLATSSDYGYEPYRTNVKAGAIALRVFDENPDHPGAAH